MNLDYNIISLIDTLGLLQGVILGMLLMIINKKREKSTLFLGLFIMTYALELLPTIIEDLGVTETYPNLRGLPLDFSWLLFPLFYVYVQQISILYNAKIDYWTLIPGVIFFVFNFMIYLMKISIEVVETPWYNLLDLGGGLFAIFIGFKTLYWISRHTREINNQYSTTEYGDLQWARLFVFLGLSLTFTMILCDMFETGFYANLLISSINIMLLYWISIRGILQQNVQTLMPVTDKMEGISRATLKKKTLNSVENWDTLLKKIESYIITEKAFIQSDLTIIDISNSIGEHPKLISRAINSCLHQNFNTYINAFRIEESIKLLKSDIADNLSIEGIAYEVGFHSRSSFYEAFKKVTGTTPSRYKKP